MRGARLAFLLLAAAWVVLLVAAPVAALGVPASGIVYAFGSLICHQRPERSFHLEAAQFPVCARCLGIYAGAALGALTAVQPYGRRVLRTLPHLRAVLIAAAVPTALTWTGEVVGLSSPSNAIRFIAALPLGVAVALTVNYVGCARPPRTEPSSPQIPT